MAAMAVLLFYKAVLVKAVTAPRVNWLWCIGYHGNPGVLAIAVD